MIALLIFALTQPNGAAIPSAMGCSGNKPTGLAAAMACVCDQPNVCNVGVPCTAPGQCDDGHHANCETTLYHSFNDNTCIPSNLSGLNPATEGAVVPETFRPTCPLTFTVITRGTAMFGDVFGWYNVTGSAPSPSDLHVMLDCHAAAGAQVVLDVANDPGYRGGEIGFFMATPEDHAHHSTCAGGDCCATIPRIQGGTGYLYFSERAYNSDNAGASSFIHLVTLSSHLQTRKFFFAWEDIYGGSNNDFTDLVTSVSGVECSGGGETCDTGKPGACAAGVSACVAGSLDCVEVVQPSPEVCDGVDNDCNGLVDDGATCPPNQVCDQGRCVPNCVVTDEFDCATTGLKCDATTGRCIDPQCAGVVCPASEICRHGSCVTPCSGVICPHGQECLGDQCVDPCAHVSCAPGQVCAGGACMAGCAECDGLVCGSGLTCDHASGACLDTSCPSCAAGTHCDNGVCVDDCAGAVCPGDEVCSGGACHAPGDPLWPGPDGGTGNGDGAAANGDGTDGGCAFCAHGAGAGTSQASAPVLLIFGGVLLVMRRRR
jgi:hypothetical protein